MMITDAYVLETILYWKMNVNSKLKFSNQGKKICMF